MLLGGGQPIFPCRLGVLANLFLEAAAAESPAWPTSGNYQILDIQTALQWLHTHIGAFGGDASKIVTFGESAGGNLGITLGAATGSAGLYRGHISESGTGANYAAWVNKTTAITLSRAFLNATPCSPSALHVQSYDSPEVLSCMRGLPAEDLVRLGGNLTDIDVTVSVVDGVLLKVGRSVLGDHVYCDEWEWGLLPLLLRLLSVLGVCDKAIAIPVFFRRSTSTLPCGLATMLMWYVVLARRRQLTPDLASPATVLLQSLMIGNNDPDAFAACAYYPDATPELAVPYAVKTLGLWGLWPQYIQQVVDAYNVSSCVSTPGAPNQCCRVVELMMLDYMMIWCGRTAVPAPCWLLAC